MIENNWHVMFQQVMVVTGMYFVFGEIGAWFLMHKRNKITITIFAPYVRSEVIYMTCEKKECDECKLWNCQLMQREYEKHGRI